MSEVTTIGLDIAKTVFHAHGADERGRGAFSKRLTRAKLLAFFSVQPRCIVALEACGGAHHWARELRALGHDVGLIPPAYVKPFVKRHKNDAVDTEAICEAAQRPSMRFVAVKSEEQHASALVFRTRDLLVLQRTQIINAIRGHLTEYSWVAPKGPAYVSMLIDLLDDDLGASLPPATVSMFRVMLDFLADLDERIAALDKEIAQRAREEETARRLMTIPGINATALMALAPVAETFVKGRDFAAWVGLTPPQHSTGGKQKLGATSKMGGVDAATAPDHRGQRRDHPGHTARDSEGIVVRTDAGAQTAHAGDGSTRQQDGEDRLGPSGEGRNLPSSDGGHGVSQNRH